MLEIVIAFKKDDEEIKDLILKQLGKDIKFLEVKGFNADEYLLVAVIPIVALTFQVIDFFKTHFTKKNTGRVIYNKKKQMIVLENYTADEVKKILESIVGS